MAYKTYKYGANKKKNVKARQIKCQIQETLNDRATQTITERNTLSSCSTRGKREQTLTCIFTILKLRTTLFHAPTDLSRVSLKQTNSSHFSIRKLSGVKFRSAPTCQILQVLMLYFLRSSSKQSLAQDSDLFRLSHPEANDIIQPLIQRSV